MGSKRRNRKREKSMFGDFEACGMGGREDEIDRYLLGELSLQEINELTTHLLACKSCLTELEFRNKLKEVIEDDGAVMFEDSRQRTLPRARRTRPVGIVPSIRGYVKQPWVFALLVIAMVTTTSLLVFVDNSQPEDFFAELNLEQKVPVRFEPDYLNTLRAPNRTGRTRTDSLTTKFLAAMRFYREMNYGTARQALDALEGEMEIVRMQSGSDKKAQYLIRDYYFFKGISVMANCRHDIEARSPALRSCVGKALASFQESFVFAEANDLAQVDGCRYFQGLSDALLGNRLAAINILEKVDAASSFSNDAVRLLASLNKE